MSVAGWLTVLTAPLVALGAAAAAPLDDPMPADLDGACWPAGVSMAPAGLDHHDEPRLPRNAKVWIFGPTPETHTLAQWPKRIEVRGYAVGDPAVPVQQIDLPELAPDAHYELSGTPRGVAAFHTDWSDDLTPPPPPQFTSVSVEVDRWHDHVTMAVAPSLDTAVLEILETEDYADSRAVTLITPPRGLVGSAPRSCAGFAFVPGERVCFRVRALDTAGNASAPVERCTAVREREAEPATPIDHGVVMAHESEFGPSAPIVAYAALVVFLGLLLGRERDRAAHAFASAHVAIDRAAAIIHIAREARRRTGMLALVAGASAAALWAVALDPTMRLWLAGLPLFVLILAVPIAIRAHRLLAALADDDAAPFVGHGYVYAARGHYMVAWLHVTTADLARATARDLPPATARMRQR